MTTITANEIKAGLNTIQAIAEAIREAREIPSGHLYAMIMNHVDIHSYTKIIDILKRSGLITEDKFNLLTWKG